MRAPQGEKVKELTASLEASLSLRNPNKKKLAGAVDLYQVDADNQQKPKRTVSFRENKPFDDAEEESDFSLESPKQSPAIKRGQQIYDGYDDDDVDKLIASYETPSKARKTLDRPAASSTPYTGGSKSTTINNAVTDFDVNDFDDDSF